MINHKFNVLIDFFKFLIFRPFRFFKRLGEKHFPFLTSKLWFFFSLFRASIHRRKLKKLGYKVFTYQEIKDTFKLIKNKEIVIFGSGPSTNELTNSFYQKCKSKFTVGISRWYFHKFVPNILFLECPDRKSKWIKDFCNGLNLREKDYLKTFILIHVDKPDVETLIKIKNFIKPSLFQNIRFISPTISANCSEYFEAVLNSKICKNLTLFSNTLMHCRSSVSYGGSFAILLNAKKLVITGVDGYSGYFEVKNTNSFNEAGLHSKNLNVQLHTTSNPKYGQPTITDCFVSISKIIPTKVSSKNTVLANHIEVIKNIDYD